jgi:hypothetical protein
MKQVIIFYFFLFAGLFFSNASFPQEPDSLIELYPGFGNEIDRFDKEYFELFNEYDDFEKAVFFIRDKKYLVSKINIYSKSNLKDAVLIQPLSSLDSIRIQISEIEKNNNNSDAERDVAIITLTGDRYEGKLEMFSKKYLYLYSDKSISTGGTSHLRVKIPVSNVEALVLPGESNTLAGLGWGALAGLVIGIGVSLTSVESSENLWIYTPEMLVSGFFMVLGAGIGALIGLGASTSDEVIEIATTYDLLKLKELAKYNPGDKTPPGKKYFTVDSL